jgi:hypothetical protein
LFALAITVAAVSIATAQAPTRKVVLEGDPAPGGGVFSFGQVGGPSETVSIAGDVIAFRCGVKVGPRYTSALFAEDHGVLRRVAARGDLVPGGVLRSMYHTRPDRLGNIFLIACVGPQTSLFPDVILKFADAGSIRIVGIGDAMPLGTVTAMGDVLAVDGQGGVYFPVWYGGASPGSALLHASPENTLTVMVATGEAAPGGGTFAAISLETLASSAGGPVAFGADVDGAPDGLFAVTPVGLERVTTDPEGIELGIYDISIDASGSVAYKEHASANVDLVTPLGAMTAIESYQPTPRGSRFVLVFSPEMGLTLVDGDLYFLAPFTVMPGLPHSAGVFKRNRDGTFEAIVTYLDPAPPSIGGFFECIRTHGIGRPQLASEGGEVAFLARTGPNNGGRGVFTTKDAADPDAPAITSVAVKNGKLVVKGTSFKRGAKLVVDARVFDDTTSGGASARTRLTSKSADDGVPARQFVAVSVLNPDGRWAPGVTLCRNAQGCLTLGGCPSDSSYEKSDVRRWVSKESERREHYH